MGLETRLHCGSEVGPPLPEVIVDVNDGHARDACPRSQSLNSERRALSSPNQTLRAGKVEGVDDVHEDYTL